MHLLAYLLLHREKLPCSLCLAAVCKETERKDHLHTTGPYRAAQEEVVGPGPESHGPAPHFRQQL